MSGLFGGMFQKTFRKIFRIRRGWSVSGYVFSSSSCSRTTAVAAPYIDSIADLTREEHRVLLEDTVIVGGHLLQHFSPIS
jgi:hypothetical protein